jgi:hypothetical protein
MKIVVYVLKERAPMFIEFAMSLSVCGVGRATLWPRTPVSVMTCKPALSVEFSQAKEGDRIADVIFRQWLLYANSEGRCGYERPCCCLVLFYMRRTPPQPQAVLVAEALLHGDPVVSQLVPYASRQ